MAVKKAVNQNYLTGETKAVLPVNEANRAFIDRFVTVNYERLNQQFNGQRNVVNSSASGSTDILNDMLLGVYTNADLHFKSQDEANTYLSNLFTPKVVRVPIRKAIEVREEDNSLCYG